MGLTTVSLAKFENHIRLLKEEGYSSVCFKDLEYEDAIPAKPIIITFDDGYESVYHHALPILLKYGFQAVVFIITDYIDEFNKWETLSLQQKHRHLSANQILNLQTHGFEIGSHSRKHYHLPFLSDQSAAEEIRGSREILQEVTGKEIISFCYPYGRCTNRIIELVRRAGYQFATRNPSMLYREPNDPLALSRRSIYTTDSIRSFKSKISGGLLAYFSEFVIQQGALASIGFSYLRTSKPHF
jgi:peptidoglycan/xylan/chitin deacetylase (PgdA/CDA1 family)